jgi:hypothetical protein
MEYKNTTVEPINAKEKVWQDGVLMTREEAIKARDNK